MKTAETMPEIYTGYRQGLKKVELGTSAVASANHYATEIGRKILDQGGNAADAAVAVQFVLGLTEPQSSGLGGGLYALYYSADTKKAKVFDGRETAPNAAIPEYRVGDIRAIPRSIGVPGTLAALYALHEKEGILSWEECIKPAQELAEHGFIISKRMADSVQFFAEAISRDPQACEIYQGGKISAGDLLINKPYARACALLIEDPYSMYTGVLAQDIMERLDKVTHLEEKSYIDAQDLAAYKARIYPCIQGQYRGHTILGPAYSSAGASIVLSILGILEHHDMGKYKVQADTLPPAELIHYCTEASRLAYADRDAYAADPEFLSLGDIWHTPEKLWDPEYTKVRYSLIQPTSMGKAEPGYGQRISSDTEEHGTSHYQIIDQWGNIASVTTSVEAAFGSFTMVSGFFLNNQLCDFSEPGTANECRGGKRPRSSMAPLIVLDQENKPKYVLGSPGGGLIIHYIVKILLCLIDFGMNPQEAANYINFGAMNNPITWLGKDHPCAQHSQELVEQLQAYGHQVELHAIPSGAAVFDIQKDGHIIAGVDPRREGAAL